MLFSSSENYFRKIAKSRWTVLLGLSRWCLLLDEAFLLCSCSTHVNRRGLSPNARCDVTWRVMARIRRKSAVLLEDCELLWILHGSLDFGFISSTAKYWRDRLEFESQDGTANVAPSSKTLTPEIDKATGQGSINIWIEMFVNSTQITHAAIEQWGSKRPARTIPRTSTVACVVPTSKLPHSRI